MSPRRQVSKLGEFRRPVLPPFPFFSLSLTVGFCTRLCLRTLACLSVLKFPPSFSCIVCGRLWSGIAKDNHKCTADVNSMHDGRVVFKAVASPAMFARRLFHNGFPCPANKSDDYLTRALIAQCLIWVSILEIAQSSVVTTMIGILTLSYSRHLRVFPDTFLFQVHISSSSRVSRANSWLLKRWHKDDCKVSCVGDTTKGLLMRFVTGFPKVLHRGPSTRMPRRHHRCQSVCGCGIER